MQQIWGFVSNQQICGIIVLDFEAIDWRVDQFREYWDLKTKWRLPIVIDDSSMRSS